MVTKRTRKVADEVGIIIAWGSLLGFLLGLGALLFHGYFGGIQHVSDGGTIKSGVTHLAAFYIPIIAAAVAFYQGMQHRGADDPGIAVPFIPSASKFLKVVYSAVILIPSVIYFVSYDINSGNTILSAYQTVVQGFLTAGLAFYFGATKQPEVAPQQANSVGGLETGSTGAAPAVGA